jgi:hypothetical protein
MTVKRYDRIVIKADDKRTPQGYLRVPARISRSGIQVYAQPDGTTRREYRPPDEVFHADALQSFSLSTLTLGHPEVPVTPENEKQFSVGTVGEVVKQDGRFVSTTVVVKDAKAIDKVLGGTQELSCGYECDLEFTAGEVDGQRYDAVQRQIRGNHVAIVPQGRAGPDVRLKLDAHDAVAVDDLAATTKEETKMVKIKIDGVEVEVSETAAQLIARSNEKHAETQKQLESAKTAAEQAKARADVAEQAKVTAEKAKQDAQDPAKIEALVSERVTLIASARKVCGDEFKADGKTPAQIRREMLAKLSPGLKLDGKSDEYVSTALEVVMSSTEDKDAGTAAQKARKAADAADAGNRHADDEIDEAAARERMKANHKDAWKSAEQKKLEAEAAQADE